MKAAVLFDLNSPLEVIELSTPSPQEGQVLVKMSYSGICHTQLLEIAGKNASGPMNPNLLGHEGSGIVEKIGKNIKKVKIGDKVILSWIKGSGMNVLPQKQIYDGKTLNVGFITTFNEYCIASENRVTKMPNKMPLKEAALIGCAVATGLGAVLNNAKVQENKSVMVFGAGGVGINMINGAKLCNANPIIAIDINNKKLEFAKKFGATYLINSKKQDIQEEIKKIAPNGIDYSFDTVGKKETMELCYNLTNKFTGKTVLCGVPNPLGLKIEIDPFPLYYGRQIAGTGGGESKPDIDFEKYCNLFMDGKLNLTEMITHVISLKDINKGIELMKEGKCCRVLIDFENGKLKK